MEQAAQVRTWGKQKPEYQVLTHPVQVKKYWE